MTGENWIRKSAFCQKLGLISRGGIVVPVVAKAQSSVKLSSAFKAESFSF